jgi:formylglycine-generating enzyme required for sulfatase activity
MKAKTSRQDEAHSFYISSPYLGLVKERERVKDLITRAGHAYRDSYGGSSEPVVNTCQNDVRKSDHYILLLSYRYGSIAKDGSGLSITELEFEAAIEEGKEIRAFFLEFTSDLKNAFDRDPAALDALDRFKARVSDICTPMLCGDEPGGGATGPELFEQAIVRLAANPPPRKGQQKQPAAPNYGPGEIEAWIETHHGLLSDAFAKLPAIGERRIHVPLALRFQEPGDKPQQLVLEAEHLQRPVEGSDAHLILIAAEGGSGKTSLAIRIGFWALEGSLGGKRRLPVLIERALGDEESLIDRICLWLEQSIGKGQLDPLLVEALLRNKRLLPIVDQFSELSEIARQRVRDTMPAGLLIVTSRRNGLEGFSERPITRITPLQIATDRLQSFFLEYLRNLGMDDRLDDSELVPAQNQLRRIVGDKPISVMLAQMFIDDVIDKREQGRGLLAGSVPELMLGYVNRLDHNLDPSQRQRAGLDITQTLVQRTLQVLAMASHKQGLNGRPLYQALAFYGEMADQILATEPPTGMGISSRRQRQSLLNYLLELRLLQHPGTNVDQLCFPFNPLAEYLAAMRQRDRFEMGEDWRPFIEDLERRSSIEREGMRGFVLALRDACHDRIKRANFPSLIPQELPDRLGRIADLDPEEERTRLEEKRAHKWLWELSVPVDSERQDAILKLAAMAAPDAPPSSQRAVKLVVSDRLAQMLDNPELPEPERQDAATVLGMLGTPTAVKALLQLLQADGSKPNLRRAAAEALGLLKPAAEQASEIEAALIDVLHQTEIKRIKKIELVDSILPLAQGTTRALGLLASNQLPLWGSGPGRPVSMASLTRANGAVSTTVNKVAVWHLPLPEGEQLELVEIPAGNYKIGSEASEEGRDEYGVVFPECNGVDVEAERNIELQAFGMGRFPITHSQWAAVARLAADDAYPELNPSPSAAQARGLWPRFAQPGSMPVDSVSWVDCQEWLRRLNQWLVGELGEGAPQLSLPSESCWEAACRAGTSTAYHWGDSLDSHWANYDGSYTYGDGRLGVFRQSPTAIGALGLVNPWGLAEMHGQLWEWCLDRWHPNPVDSPKDGRAWEEPDPSLKGNPKQEDRLARGGCWCSDPRQCRSASRGGIGPVFRDSFVGFRVACLPPGWGSSSPKPASPEKSPSKRRSSTTTATAAAAAATTKTTTSDAKTTTTGSSSASSADTNTTATTDTTATTKTSSKTTAGNTSKAAAGTASKTTTGSKPKTTTTSPTAKATAASSSTSRRKKAVE